MLTRVPRTRAATLSHTFYVDETATDATATVTVAITDATGASVSSGSATHGATGVYTYALGAQAAVALLTVAWTATIGGVAVVERDTVEICGGYLFDLAAARASDSSLSSTGTYPTSALITGRLRVEQEVEHICDRAFTTRYARVTLNGTGTPDLVLANPLPDRSARDVRTIRSASIAATTGGTAVALTTAQLAVLAVRPDGSLRRTDGNVWTEGSANVVIEYEYGRDAPPEDLVEALYARLRYRLQHANSGIPDRAIAYTAPDGTSYRLGAPGPYTTGMPEVDGVYGRYSLRSTDETAGGSGGHAAGQGRPAARNLRYLPQRYSLFHGWSSS